MDESAFDRYKLPKPEHVGDAHATAIELEADRFRRAVKEGDQGQALGYLKCLIEAIAKVALDLNGTPAAGRDSFDTLTKAAHDLLAHQRGHELAFGSEFGNLATQARKMAVSMSTIRNAYGGGHGRARQPELRDEMLELAMDASLLWARWALRRLGYFALGRPESLIRDLVGDPGGQISFHSGDLAGRLESADLASLDPRHSRAIGVSVGQRASRGTFNVRIEGVDPVDDHDLDRWPAAYRLGVAHGLLFGPDELPTISTQSLFRALQLCLPILSTHADAVANLIMQVTSSAPPSSVTGLDVDSDLAWLVAALRSRSRPEHDPTWDKLESYLNPIAN